MAELRVLDAEPATDPSIVERLEMALERARRGELSSVAIAWVNRDGSTGQTWSRMPSFGALLGSVTHLVFRLNKALDDG